jgi:hypothetical protein
VRGEATPALLLRAVLQLAEPKLAEPPLTALKTAETQLAELKTADPPPPPVHCPRTPQPTVQPV